MRIALSLVLLGQPVHADQQVRPDRKATLARSAHAAQPDQPEHRDQQGQLEPKDPLGLMRASATTRWKVMGLHHAILGIRSLAAVEAAALIPTTS